MNTRSIILAAIGGAALVAIPTTVAVAMTNSDDVRPGMGWHSDDVPGRGADTANRTQNARYNDSTMGMGGAMGAGYGMNDDDDRRGGVGYGMNGVDDRGAGAGFRGNSDDASCVGIGDPAALVADGATLTSADEMSLEFMVQEEKLAHDLYAEFADAWELRVFDNISSAEQQHMDSVGALLDAYGVDDPTDSLATGEFANSDLQDLYDTLLAQGLESSTQALNAAALVEETDINDLRDRATTNDAITYVFANLESGSENHLRAFVMNLDRAGVDYEARILSDSEVSGITGR